MAAMKWLLLGCFHGNQRLHGKGDGPPQALVTLSRSHGDTVAAACAETTPLRAAPAQPHDPRVAATGPSGPLPRSEERNLTDGRASSDGDALSGQAQADSVTRIAVSQKFIEAQELPAPRLSLDCGVGIGPSPPNPPPPAAPPITRNGFSRPPSAVVNIPLPLMVRASIDTASADTPVDSTASDGSSGILAFRGGPATAMLTMPFLDTTGIGSRHQVSRAFHGRASLDALLMLGALVRAADDAGLAVTGVGGTPRLERIESGDLPLGEDGHQDRQPQARPSRQTGSASATAATRVRAQWCAEADTGPRVAPRPQRRGLWWSQPELNGSSSSGSSGGGATTAAASGVGKGPAALSPECSGGSVASGAAGPCGAPTNAADAAALVHIGHPDPDFTFSPPTVASLRQSVDNSRGQHSDLLLLGATQCGNLHPHVQGGFAGQVADSNQILELFMRFVTNCSTVGDNDLPSSSCGADRSSAGTAYGSRGTTGTGLAPQPAVVAGSTGVPGAATAPAVAHRKPHVQRSASERHRNGNGRRLAGFDGAAGQVTASSPYTAAAAAAAAATAAAAAAFYPDEAGSAPLLKQHVNLRAAGASNGSGGGGSGRRNSWDTLAGSSGSAMAVAAAAAAALAAAGLLRGSVGSRNTAGAGGALSGGDGSSSVRTGSASRFWPMGGMLQEDSGPASMLLLGALSGGMSLGGNTSRNSLVQLPMGSGCVRDALSRIRQQQVSLHEGGVQATSSTSSWSAHTGLASLFDAHLTAALRRNGAVHTFQRAIGGAPNLSHTSSATSPLTGTLGRHDTSLSLTSGLMMLNFGSNTGSSAADGAVGSGGAGGGAGGGGVSQLGVASAGTVAAAAAGILVIGLPPPRIRQATISSISTIHSSPEAAGGFAVQNGISGNGRGRCAQDTVNPPIATAAAARAFSGYQRSFVPGGSAGDAPFGETTLVPRQLHTLVLERQQASYHHQQHQQQHQHQHHAPRLRLHHQYQQVRITHQGDFGGRRQAVQSGSSSGDVALACAAAAAAAASAAARSVERNPLIDDTRGQEERASLSLTLGLASGSTGVVVAAAAAGLVS